MIGSNSFAYRCELMNNYLMSLSYFSIPKHRPLEGWNFKSYFWVHKTYCKVSAYLFNSILDVPQHRCIGGPGERLSGPGHHLSSEPMSNVSKKSRQIGCKRAVASSTDSELTCETRLLRMSGASR